MKQVILPFKFYFLLSIFIFSYFFNSQAQTATGFVKGKVTAPSGEKLDAAGLFLKGTKYSALTGSDGTFLIKQVPAGDYQLVCSYIGYKDYETPVTVSSSQTSTVNIVLDPDIHTLEEAVIIGQKEVNTVKRMPETEGTMIYAAKRNDVIQMDRQNANVAKVVTRQIFSKVPGVNLWEFDGSGNQISVGTRGLNPHRSIEMNVRQNGFVINSDLFGYPEAHYAPAMGSVEKIEIIRGSAALQYGPQFGGLLNYILRTGDPNKKFTYRSQQTFGSQQLVSTFNSIGGTVGKWNYYASMDYRSSAGYRPNGQYHNYTGYATLGYKFSDKVSARFEYSYLDYVDRLSGGLTDSMFEEDPYQSTRSRNYFQPHFNIPALHLNINLSEKTSISLVSSYLIGQRNSVMFIQPPDVPDTIITATMEYAPRQVDRDWYHAWSNEARLLQKYNFLNHESALSVGVRYSINKTRRAQRAPGTTADDFDLTTTAPYLTDLHFTTTNFAVFAENVFHFGENFSLTPGVRLDVLKTTSTGYVNYLPSDLIIDKTRNIPLFGCGAQYNVSHNINVYANVSQAYRPVQYNDLIPSASLDVIDPNLKDSHGYQADLGIRGSVKDILRFDAGLYYLYYGDRIGRITVADSSSSYVFRTNTGNSEAKGIEVFAEFHPLNLFNVTDIGDISIYSSTSTDHALYVDGSTIAVAGVNEDITGNKLENAPDLISRNGITYSYKRFSGTVEYSYTSETFSDANNTVSSANAITGIVPAYGLFDFSAVLDFGKYNIAGGINNFTNQKYFTRRINTYPGPGILPGDGRSFYVSVGAKF